MCETSASQEASGALLHQNWRHRDRRAGGKTIGDIVADDELLKHQVTKNVVILSELHPNEMK
jgi:hypothetical protein